MIRLFTNNSYFLIKKRKNNFSYPCNDQQENLADAIGRCNGLLTNPTIDCNTQLDSITPLVPTSTPLRNIYPLYYYTISSPEIYIIIS